MGHGRDQEESREQDDGPSWEEIEEERRLWWQAEKEKQWKEEAETLRWEYVDGEYDESVPTYTW
jgi:hypothetical protein